MMMTTAMTKMTMKTTARHTMPPVVLRVLLEYARRFFARRFFARRLHVKGGNSSRGFYQLQDLRPLEFFTFPPDLR
jgi:hypothetical protein